MIRISDMDEPLASSHKCELKSGGASLSSLNDPPRKTRKRPFVLHPVVGWGLVVLCILLCATLAVLYRVSQRNNGLFTIYPTQGLRSEVLQFLWSSGPTFVMTIIVGGILGPLAFELYVVAPYAELEKRSATAQAFILANYVVLGPYKRFCLALNNRKWGLVTLAIASFLAVWLNTPASGLLESRNVVVRIQIEQYHST